MKKLHKAVLFYLVLFSALAMAESLYDMNGSRVDLHNKTKGPKALVKTESTVKNEHSSSIVIRSPQDTFFISKESSEQWLEMEKNTNYSICIQNDDENGFWKGKNFSYEKTGTCIKINSGKYIKSGQLQYVTSLGHVYTLNLLVGMKYIDLSEKKHLLGGYSGSTDISPINRSSMVYKLSDPVRFDSITEILVVDKYKVTECEFIHALWDSIPVQTSENLYDNSNYWIKKRNIW